MLKKCDLSRYTWLLLDRLLRLSHFCTRNAASLTVLDQALYCDGIPRNASRFYPPCSRQLSCLHGQRYYFVIHLPRMCTVTSRIREIFPCGIQNPGIQNTALGIRNPTNDWHPESKFHWQYLESGIHCVELMWQVLAVVNMLARLLLASCLRCLANLHSSFLFYFFFSFYTFVFYPRHHELHPRSTTPACLRPTAFSYTPGSSDKKISGLYDRNQGLFLFVAWSTWGPKKRSCNPVVNRLHSTLTVFGNNKILIRWN